MPLLVRYWGRWVGDCELVATDAMFDLERAGASGWQHLEGEARFGHHHWLEAGEWALDLSNGCEKPVVVAARAAFYDLIGLAWPMVVTVPASMARLKTIAAVLTSAAEWAMVAMAEDGPRPFGGYPSATQMPSAGSRPFRSEPFSGITYTSRM